MTEKPVNKSCSHLWIWVLQFDVNIYHFREGVEQKVTEIY